MRRWAWGVIAVGLTGLVPAAAEAQYNAPPPMPAYAMENVSVVQPNGQRLDGLTVIVRNGLISVMAPSVVVPADATLLEGEGLVIYPGIVDGHGDVDATWPDARDVEDPDDVTAWAPPRSRQGFMPHRRLADHIAAPGEAIAESRKAGVVASLAHPSGGMAAGQSAVLVHRDSEAPWGIVEHDAPGIAMSFQAAGGVYPSQLFGVIAYLRQAFMDAERYETMRAASRAQNPTFVAPGWDPDYEAMRRAARGEQLVYFQADSDEDIRRVLNLADEFGFRVAIVGGDEAWKLADELAERQVPVFVSLDFPNLRDWDPDEDAEGDLEPAAAREKESMEALWSNAGRLAAAGVTFALTSGGGSADILEGVQKVVEYGLSPEAAMRAITTTPAALLGIDNIVNVQAGGPATFMVASGDLMEEGTAVRYTFVEGVLSEGAAAGGGGGGDAPSGNISGTWSGTIEAGGQSSDASLTITQAEDGSISGSIQGDQLPPSDIGGRISGSTVTIEIMPEGLPEPIVLTGTLSADGNTITGGGSTPFGEMTFEMTRGGGQADWSTFLGGGR